MPLCVSPFLTIWTIFSGLFFDRAKICLASFSCNLSIFVLSMLKSSLPIFLLVWCLFLTVVKNLVINTIVILNREVMVPLLTNNDRYYLMQNLNTEKSLHIYPLPNNNGEFFLLWRIYSMNTKDSLLDLFGMMCMITKSSITQRRCKYFSLIVPS